MNFCSKCNEPIKPIWDKCPSCGAEIIKERTTDNLGQVDTSDQNAFTRKSYFWKINMLGAILVVATLVLPYQFFRGLVIGPPDLEFIGFWWLLGIEVNISINSNVLLFAMINIAMFVLIFHAATTEKNSKGLDTKIVRTSAILIVAGIVLASSNLFLLIFVNPPQSPSVQTTIFPVGPILAFLASGIVVFSGILGLVKELSN